MGGGDADEDCGLEWVGEVVFEGKKCDRRGAGGGGGLWGGKEKESVGLAGWGGGGGGGGGCTGAWKWWCGAGGGEGLEGNLAEQNRNLWRQAKDGIEKTSKNPSERVGHENRVGGPLDHAIGKKELLLRRVIVFSLGRGIVGGLMKTYHQKARKFPTSKLRN